jgi:UDP-glucose 4-epimerase
MVVKEMGLKDVKFTYTGGKRGWKGDVPRMLLSIDKLKKLGWEPVHNSKSSIVAAIRSTLGIQ